MAFLSNLLNWGRSRQRERPSARQQSQGYTGEARKRAQAKIEQQVQERGREAAADWDRRERQRKQQEIQERIARDRAAGNIPTGILEDSEDVDPWHTIGSTGASILDPSEIGDPLDNEDLRLFLNGKFTIMADSSNVESIAYDPERMVLTVGYKAKGRWPASQYEYEPVSKDKAMLAFTASSKGSFCWDQLRIRGTKYGHQVGYRRIY